MDSAFKGKVDARDYTVAVIGLGYVGLPLVIAIWEREFKLLGLDLDSAKTDQLLSGASYIQQIPDERIGELISSGRFEASTDYSKLTGADAILLCVPTPLTKNQVPDMSFIVSTAESIAPHLRNGHLVVLESTTYPGTTVEVLRPILEKGGLRSGKDFFLAYSPEREDPGNDTFSTSSIPKVVGGDGAEALERAAYFYEQIVPEVVPVSSTKTAEAVKLTENIFRSVNIALVNELKVIYSKMGIDIWEVIDAAKTKPFGFMPFYPGPGLGGHCIPIDPFYLAWKAREYGCATRFIELAGEINVAMPEYVLRSLTDALNDGGKALRGSSILLLGIAYKKDVDDLRESPSLVLLDGLLAAGAHVDYHDPHIPTIKATRNHPDVAGRTSVELSPESLKKYDAVLIATDHSSVDYQELVDHAKLVVDTRNATKDVERGREKIVKT